ncbi:Crp/Fnr family transcriptional regulator [Nocardiopsis sp. FR4]|uniref:Crp/Fnr family transcriptional regulator n=1 Tax=Nocardiopsis sp. FR4 TaxID=2605985 RepID=UPI001358E8D9|nr:cyclic nucleotide-binding domain-containing protein [Nocardiopsis sp. FR4]
MDRSARGGRTSSPLDRSDISALAASLGTRRLQRGETAFESHRPSTGVWIVRSGRPALETDPNGSYHGVLRVLRPGDVDGDIQSLLCTPMAYTARAVEDSVCLCVAPDRFARLLRRHPTFTRRWMSSIAERLERSQDRVAGRSSRSSSTWV